MKLVRATIDGFRLLTGLEINFSLDVDRNITVIRAANESGKTTLLSALQWGLIGDRALQNGYKIRPMDLGATETSITKVKIEYEISNRNGHQRYLIERSVETSSDETSKNNERLDLFQITDDGYEPITSPVNHLQQHFPSELREVFFTDGDRALSFIEGPRAEQQHKVRAAIEKMMGLSMLEKTINHIKANEKRLRARFDQEAGDSETHQIKQDLERIDQELPALELKRDTTLDEFGSLNDKHQKAERDLEHALKMGNREELAKELRTTKDSRTQMMGQRKKAELKQSAILSSENLARHMAFSQLQNAGKMLDDLRNKGQIPNKIVPILEDRLNHADCICGELLDEQDSNGQRRREHIKNLIRDSQDADNLKSKVSDLYFQGKSLFSGKPGSWKSLYSETYTERNVIRSVCNDLGNKEAELETKISQIPDTNVERLRSIRVTYVDKIRDCTTSIARLEADIKHAKKSKNELEIQFRTLSARNQKGEKIARELNVAADMRLIVERSLQRMKTLEVKQVSDTMNDLFLNMIGADEHSALIIRAEITPEFRIVVYGRGGGVMDPSLDLNGASRRALTIAFVLALTKISGVEAPNVIDTPLGMMSGFVKSEVVKIASENSDQLILLLTHDEIKGCEDILSERTSYGLTMTNPAHYPKILKNDPGTSEVRVLQCDCNHLSSCKLCDRFENSTDAAMEVA